MYVQCLSDMLSIVWVWQSGANVLVSFILDTPVYYALNYIYYTSTQAN